MKNILPEKFNIIVNISPKKLQDVGKVKRAQAQNYKNSSSLPPLDKAFLFEKELDIPMPLWIELREYRQGAK